MLKQRIQEHFNEPGCSVNRGKSAKERKQGCGASAKLAPGGGAAGCAYDGAKICLQPIADSAHLVHGAAACECNGWDGRHTPSSGPETYRTGLTTDLSELDIIHGGEPKLARAIDATVERLRPRAVFVYATCVTSLIGDDLEAVCREAAKRTSVPVIPVEAPGFAGSKNLGNKLAGDALFRHVIGTQEPVDPGPTDINLLGEYNVAGELWQVLPLLERLGIRVHATITGDGRYDRIASCHRSRLNLIICSQALIGLARQMEGTYGIPYLEGSFYGIADTSATLRAVAGALFEQGGPADLPARTEALIAEEEAKTWVALEPYRPRLTGKKVLLYTGGVKSWSVVSALQEIGCVVTGTSIRKSTAEDKEKAKALLGQGADLFGSLAPKEMDRRFRAGEADILVSGGRTQFTALKARLPWMDINQERAAAFAGYAGMVEFVRTLDREVNNPVWPTLRRPAPWDLEARPGFDPRQPGAAAKVAHQDAPDATPVLPGQKPVTINPLKVSAPLGAALAFTGVDGSFPLFHGAQGCTAFSVVQIVRHFREAAPFQTTAMDSLTTILGGADNMEKAIETLRGKGDPRLIGIVTTALTETRGEDMAADLKALQARHPEWEGLAIVFASAPDYGGALETGWSRATTALIETLAEPPGPVVAPRHINLLPGSHLTPADLDELRDLVEGFGATVTILPDLSGALDGHVPDAYTPTSLGGTTVDEIRAMGRAAVTIALGEQMRAPAAALQAKTGVPFRVIDRLVGLAATDQLVALLSDVTDRPVPERVKRDRNRLVDGMLDSHFWYGGKRAAIGADPDLLLSLSAFLAELGCDTAAAVASEVSPALSRVPAGSVTVGDLDDLERLAAGCDLLLTTSHGRQAASRLGLPHHRIGFPVLDRVGNAERLMVGYRGARRLLFELANLLIAEEERSAHGPAIAHRDQGGDQP